MCAQLNCISYRMNTVGWGRPEALPLDSPEQLLQWAPGASSAGDLCVPAVPLPRRQGAKAGPKLLACHDMAGGYGEDRWVQGGSDASFYYLRHWHCLDAFVYFSHRLVTIPPPGWINAAHTHSVPVLGTLITEWEAGAEHCQRLFGSVAAAEEAAAQLAAIAQHHGFEGWVVNIENKVLLEHIPHLLHFLRVLTALMHEVAPCWGQVMWYDAVTTEGKLQWQDTLNSLNRPFFDACDAIWINYTWKQATPAAVRKEAGDRAADVYMGVDCFGRGTYGGGGFSCDVALKACREQGLSAALFAVGWPYEGDCGPDAPQCWRQRDAGFWSRVHAAWDAAGSGASSSESSSKSSTSSGGIKQLPFWSNFSVGSGQAVFEAGQQLCGNSWYNLSMQSQQPVLRVSLGPSSSSAGGEGAGSSQVAVSDGGSCASPFSTHSSARAGSSSVLADITSDLAYSGGTSVRVNGSLQPGQLATVQLYPAAVQLPAAGILVRITCRPATGIVDCRLVLRLAPLPPADASSEGSGDLQVDSSIELPLCSSQQVADGDEAGVRVPAAAAQPVSCGGRTAAVVAATACMHTPCAAAGSASVGAAGSNGNGRVDDGGGGNPAAAPAAAAVAPASDVPCWKTWEYHLAPEVLAVVRPAGGDSSSSSSSSSSTAVQLTGVDLVLLGTEEGGTEEGSPTAASFQIDLGELCIEPAPGSGPSPSPATGGVRQLRCTSLQVRAGTGLDEPAAEVSAQLSWKPPPGGARHFHVWCVAHNGSSGNDGCLEKRKWLGCSPLGRFWVSGLTVPSSTAELTFVVQPVSISGLAQPFHEAAHVSVAAGLAAGADAAQG